MKKEMFFQKLVAWYDENARDLPWRKTNDPYAIWVSEVMLQQTQVERVKVFFVRFMKRFPRIRDLAEAEWSEVLEYWRGLGYYRRARNLHAAAKIMVAECEGVFPKSIDELRKLPGVGVYTAAAVASFAFGEMVPALDTNLQRFFSRLFGETWETLSPFKQREFARALMPKSPRRSEKSAVVFTKGARKISQNSEAFLRKTRPAVSLFPSAVFNHALMDMGAMVCLNRDPRCIQCPFQRDCFFAKKMRKNESSVSEKKESVSQKERGGLVFPTSPHFPRRINVAAGVIIHHGKVLISKRRKGGSFAGFWEFPGGKLHEGEDERACLKREIKEELDIEVSVRPAFYRVATEDEGMGILLSFHRCSWLLGEPKTLEVEEFRWVQPEELSDFQFPPVNREVVAILLRKKAMFRV